MIPRQFSRLQVLMIVTFVIMNFYFFHKDINTGFDNIDKYSGSHPTEISYGIWALLGTMISVLAVAFLKILLIEPWQDRRLDARLQKCQLQRILDALEKGRPLIAKTEEAMESCNLMVMHEQYKRNVRKWKL